jgi:hypothetical protein
MSLPVPQVVIPQEWERCLLESEVLHEKTPEHTNNLGSYVEGIQQTLLGDWMEAFWTATMVAQPHVVARTLSDWPMLISKKMVHTIETMFEYPIR